MSKQLKRYYIDVCKGLGLVCAAGLVAGQKPNDVVTTVLCIIMVLCFFAGAELSHDTD